MNIKIILENSGWKDLGEQKMKGMLSFTKGNLRMNLYTTTGTLTLQETTKKFDKGRSWKNVTEESVLENILLNEI